MEIFNLGDGARAIRHRSQRAGLDVLTLETEGAPDSWREIWRMEIPPKMPDEELASQAGMYLDIWLAGRDVGADEARRAVMAALDNLDLICGEAC